MSEFIVDAISGKKGTGKDYMADLRRRQDPDGTVILAFADAIKTHLYALGDSDVMLAEKPASTRIRLIDVGTETRQKFGDEYYAYQMLGAIELQKSRGMRRVIISDLRFKTELQVLRNAAVQGKFKLRLFRMEAPIRNKSRILKESGGDTALAERLAANPSETELDEISRIDDSFEIIHND